jgi:lipopolysaccharide export system permease protein
MLTATDRYIARLIFLPLVATLVISAMLLVLDKMLRLFNFVAAEGGPVSVVWKMLASVLPEYLSLGIPIGLLLGILLAFRRLALSSELDALRAVGLSYWRLLRVPFLYAITLAIVNLAIVGFAQPYARFQYERLGFELRSGALGASVKVGEFTRLGKNLTMRIEQSANEGRELSGLFVMTEGKKGQTLAVTAAKGAFLATDDPDTIILRLTNGVLVHNSPKLNAPRILNFTSHDLPIDLPRIEAFRNRGGKDRELTIPELVLVSSNPKTPAAVRNETRANFHFRLAEVAMMLLLPMLALALAVPPKRSSSGLGIFVAIVMVVAYHKVNEYAESIGGLGRVDPFFALWIPFVIFAALIGWMYYTIAHVPGGQPIGGIDRAAGKLGAAIRGLFARREPKLAVA